MMPIEMIDWLKSKIASFCKQWFYHCKRVSVYQIIEHGSARKPILSVFSIEE